jgi:hypothetical protein
VLSEEVASHYIQAELSWDCERETSEDEDEDEEEEQKRRASDSWFGGTD